MTIQELEQKLNECQKELAELKESKKEKWKPEVGEKYWLRNTHGLYVHAIWTDSSFDNWRYNNIPIFKTKEECERYWHFMDTVKEKSYEFSKEEWKEDDIPKFCICYLFNNKCFRISVTHTSKCFGEVYFKTESDAQYIIDNFKEELIEFWL